MKKGKKREQAEKPQTNGDSSPIMYRRALQCKKTDLSQNKNRRMDAYITYDKNKPRSYACAVTVISPCFEVNGRDKRTN